MLSDLSDRDLEAFGDLHRVVRGHVDDASCSSVSVESAVKQNTERTPRAVSTTQHVALAGQRPGMADTQTSPPLYYTVPQGRCAIVTQLARPRPLSSAVRSLPM